MTDTSDQPNSKISNKLLTIIIIIIITIFFSFFSFLKSNRIHDLFRDKNKLSSLLLSFLKKLHDKNFYLIPHERISIFSSRENPISLTSNNSLSISNFSKSD